MNAPACARSRTRQNWCFTGSVRSTGTLISHESLASASVVLTTLTSYAYTRGVQGWLIRSHPTSSARLAGFLEAEDTSSLTIGAGSHGFQRLEGKGYVHPEDPGTLVQVLRWSLKDQTLSTYRSELASVDIQSHDKQPRKGVVGCFIISLAAARERRRHVERVLFPAVVGLDDPVVINAVDGRNLSSRDRAALVAPTSAHHALARRLNGSEERFVLVHQEHHTSLCCTCPHLVVSLHRTAPTASNRTAPHPNPTPIPPQPLPNPTP